MIFYFDVLHYKMSDVLESNYIENTDIHIKVDTTIEQCPNVIQNIAILLGKLDENISIISNDIEHLDNLHKKITSNSDKKNRFYNYGIYIDDIFFQKRILEKEMLFFKEITMMIKRKLYGDLFRLYIKIIKLLNDLKYNFSGKSNLSHEIIKKELLSDIKIFKELDDNAIYLVDDIIKLYEKIIEKINEIDVHLSDIDKIIENTENTENTEHNKSDGNPIQMYLIGLEGEKISIKSETENFKVILNGILEINSKLIQKYIDSC